MDKNMKIKTGYGLLAQINNIHPMEYNFSSIEDIIKALDDMLKNKKNKRQKVGIAKEIIKGNTYYYPVIAEYKD